MKTTLKTILATAGIVGALACGFEGIQYVSIKQDIKEAAKGDPQRGYVAAKAALELINRDASSGRERVTFPCTEIVPRFAAESYMKEYASQIGGSEKAEAFAKQHPVTAYMRIGMSGSGY